MDTFNHPFGLVPKDNGTSTRLIFHLSYPRVGVTSVNQNTPRDTVQYLDIVKAIKLCLKEGRNCSCSKSDWKSAFSNFPILKKHWKFLVMKARSPIDKKWYFFVDKCMPFGSSISCAHFQAFSDAISHVMRYLTGKENVNYLDDFLFISLMAWYCNYQVEQFLEICQRIGFPVALGKTCWATDLIGFLGMLLDTKNQRILIPHEKIEKAHSQISEMLSSRKH